MSHSLPLPGFVWLRRARLDSMLAAGADPHGTPALERRAAQLTSRRHRRSLAAGIERTLEAAEGPARPLSPAAPLQRREILAARAQLEQVAADLAGGYRESAASNHAGLLTRLTSAASLEDMSVEPYGARGVALVQRLLTDGDSPLYAPCPAGELKRTVRRAHAALLLR